MKELIKKAWGNPDFQKKLRTLAWQTANGTIVLLIGLATTLQPDVINPTSAFILAAVLAGLNALTKWINKTYLS